MIQLLSSVWALLLGIFLLMVGNGMQATLMGVRGDIEGFSTFELSLVTSGYFMGFLAGSRMTPEMIRRVSHVRVFAALGSLMSAGLIAFPMLTDPWSWTLLRLLLGFCLSGIYVTSESWLNDRATNATRGTLLSAYMVAQTLGMVAAQGLLNFGDAAGYGLFIAASILVSVAFTPVLLSAVPVPAAEAIKPMSLRQLYERSPLASVGTLILGGVFAAQMGMASVYGAKAGLSVQEISAFVAALFIGSFLFQFPVGWASDLMDRRLLILTLAAAGAVSCVFGFLFQSSLTALLGAALFLGGTASPLYSLFIAYTNDYLEPDEMAAAASGMVFVYGVGAILGPIVTGQVMDLYGPELFWAVLGILFLAIACWTAWRMTRRAAPAGDGSAYLNVLPNSSTVAVGAAYEWYADAAEEEGDADEKEEDERAG
ncbi:major facilitator transporter [Roseivivax halodurans JCM 10272]|uniref:Major facilitator transporter n=1 Tax=Roseivivax halodurans JCM 10272 TaxID=1449350 RepID=X7EKG7_9RHOB|nr:MFS transporter [Roseivivax halodurans]ETX16594.1 major facilitator transporter [Roseivivax halodurans JCM 10272]